MRWTTIGRRHRPGATQLRAVPPVRERLRAAGRAEATPLDSRVNGTTLLRTLMALLVMLSHAFLLGGFGADPIGRLSDGQISLGTLAVAGFFFISGFFITRSFGACNSVWRYLWHRALRILPAYWVCLLLTTFVLGTLAHWIEYGTVLAYLQQRDPARYIHQNEYLFIKKHLVDHLFMHNPLPRSFNDSLWTLEVEARCYIGVALLGALGVFARSRPLIPLITGALWFLYLYGTPAFYAHDTLIPHPSYTMPYLYFGIGATCYLYRERVRLAAPPALLAAALTAVSFRTGTAPYLLPPTFCYLLLYAGFASPLRRLAIRTDLSYGIYIYAFPLQQVLALADLNRFGVVPYYLFSILLTLPPACLSWYAVERPCLRLKSILRPTTGMEARAA